jgi:PKD repeat protein
VNFTDLSYDTDGSVVNWSWDFGDGNSSFDQNPVHSYGDGRLYEVYLTVLDDDGFIDIKSGRVNVSNVAPVANFSWDPLYPTTSDFVNFTDLSYDTDGSVVYWSWDFGDGNSSFDQNPVHSYGDDGVYTVTLIVVDDDDEVDTYSDNVIISNVAPVANFSWSPIYPTTSDLVNFTDLSYDTDGSVVNWSWDFGDGNNSYTQNPSHQYENYGEYIITLKIIDNQGLNDTINKNISVLITINITLNVGWNLINIPVNNSFMASELADDINGCISINRWDNINQTYKPYIVGGPPDFDFEVSPGMGLFVETSEFNLFIVRGYPVQNVSINLEIPWNMIGWYQEYDTNASSLSENISGCQTVNMWDSVNQTYRPYIVGGPPDFDFPVNAGMGLFVEVDEASIWYGDG